LRIEPHDERRTSAGPSSLCTRGERGRSVILSSFLDPVSEALLGIFAARGFTLTEAERTEILCAQFQGTFFDWIKASVTAPSVRKALDSV
jgi:hypothetical protein